jgi:hypothetical protein
MAYQITNQRDLRKAFWEDRPDVSRKRGRDGDYLTDTRVAFVDYIEHMARDGLISQQLAQRVML